MVKKDGTRTIKKRGEDRRFRWKRQMVKGL